jgi:hypothetical protein
MEGLGRGRIQAEPNHVEKEFSAGSFQWILL